MTRIWVDGEPDAGLPADDRGLAFGHGVFETMPVIFAAIPHWRKHWRRLSEGCRRLGIAPPEEHLVRDELKLAVKAQERAVLKLIVTAGSSHSGYSLPLDSRPRRIMILRPWPIREIPPAGIRLRWCDTRLPIDPVLAGIKHLNRLHSVMARAEWEDEVEEGLMLDQEGFVVEGTMSNVFWVEGATLVTPDLKYCGVAGVMRERIFEWAASHRVEVCQARSKSPRLLAADGVFVCNSLIGIWPVERIGTHRFAQARLTKRLLDAVAEGEC